MGFADAVKSCLTNYANFKGRAPRAEFWWFYLFNLAALFVAFILDSLLIQTGQVSGAYLYLAVSLGLILPNLAVAVRRLHDVDRSGAWLLAFFIPLVGFILLLIWFCTPGNWGSNTYGPDPYRGLVTQPQ